MKYDQEYIYTLLLRKQLRELSEVEDQLLQKVMQTDEQVRKCWYEQEQAILYTDSAFLDDLRVERDWCKIAAILTPQPLHLRLYRYVKHHRAAAAVLLTATAFASGWYSFKHYYKLPSPPATIPVIPCLQILLSALTAPLTRSRRLR
jgi:hypothetical protein